MYFVFYLYNTIHLKCISGTYISFHSQIKIRYRKLLSSISSIEYYDQDTRSISLLKNCSKSLQPLLKLGIPYLISKNNKFDQIFTKLIDHFIVRLDYLIQKRTHTNSHLVSKLEKILFDRVRQLY